MHGLCNMCYNQFLKEISSSSVVVLCIPENAVCFGVAEWQKPYSCSKISFYSKNLKETANSSGMLCTRRTKVIQIQFLKGLCFFFFLDKEHNALSSYWKVQTKHKTRRNGTKMHITDWKKLGLHMCASVRERERESASLCLVFVPTETYCAPAVKRP